MDVSHKDFEAFVRAETEGRSKILNVRVFTWGFALLMDTRRHQRYEVSAHWNPKTNLWTMYDPHRGNTIRHVVDGVDRRLRGVEGR